jgi:hypothetical protein
LRTAWQLVCCEGLGDGWLRAVRKLSPTTRLGLPWRNARININVLHHQTHVRAGVIGFHGSLQTSRQMDCCDVRCPARPSSLLQAALVPFCHSISISVLLLLAVSYDESFPWVNHFLFSYHALPLYYVLFMIDDV